MDTCSHTWAAPRVRLQGESFFHIFHAVDEPLVRQAWRTALHSKNTFEAEARVRSAEGSYRWFLVRAVPQLDDDGAVARWYGIHIDIEEQRQAQQSLAEAQEEQSRVSHLLSMAEMAASIAHELNQPLTAVVTHAYACREWLREDALNIAKALRDSGEDCAGKHASQRGCQPGPRTFPKRSTDTRINRTSTA